MVNTHSGKYSESLSTRGAGYCHPRTQEAEASEFKVWPTYLRLYLKAERVQYYNFHPSPIWKQMNTAVWKERGGYLWS